jgi:hypothetical protein
MDWISYTVSATAALLDDCLRGKPAAPRLARHNEKFRTSYARWFEAIYRDKYFYMADQELMTLAFRLDINLYYLGVVTQPFKHGPGALEMPSFASKQSRMPAKLIAFYNRRLATIAKCRLARGAWGKTNAHHHTMVRLELDRWLPLKIARAFLTYAKIEIREGWRTWFREPPPVVERLPHSTRAAPRDWAVSVKTVVSTEPARL